MLEKLINYKKLIPNEYYDTVYDIDYKKLYKEGKRVIFFDLDNTLISYREKDSTDKISNLFSTLQSIGFEVLIVSNSPKKRVKRVANALEVNYVSRALKPLKMAFHRALRKCNKKYKVSEAIQVGDQLFTDIYGANRKKIFTILVNPIDHKTDIFITRINRAREKKFVDIIKEKNLEEYINKLQKYESENL